MEPRAGELYWLLPRLEGDMADGGPPRWSSLFGTEVSLISSARDRYHECDCTDDGIRTPRDFSAASSCSVERSLTAVDDEAEV